MADDDNPFDYAFGQFGDQNPPGTMTPFGIGPNDPLIDWGSNMKPADVARYVHDPEGFKNDMVNSGQAPPGHDYVQGPSGLQPVDKSGQPIRTTAQGRIQGNVSDYSPPLGFSSEPPPRPEDTAGKPSDRRPIPPTQTIPPSGPLAGPDATLGPPQGPLAPVAEKVKKWLNTPAQAAPAPAPSTTPYGPPPPPGYGAALDADESAPPPQVPLPRPRPATATPSTPEKEKKVEALSSEAMSDFAKSLQGVKAPTRPTWQPMGAPAVRSPVAVHPEVQSLLSAIGQSRPSPQQVALMRLLGRI